MQRLRAGAAWFVRHIGVVWRAGIPLTTVLRGIA